MLSGIAVKQQGSDMELGTLLTTGSAAIDLTTKLAEIVKRYQDSNESERMASIIFDLKKAALEMTRDFNDELQEINSEFFSSGIDTSMSLNQLNSELRWYNFQTKSKINSYEKKFKSLYERLSGFLDDVTAIAICSDTKEPLSSALNAATERSYSLSDVFHPDRPLSDIFNIMQQIVRELHDQLQGGQVAEVVPFN